jgi:hypothetical protein
MVHWRARIISRDPFFPRSPWMSVAGNNVTEKKFRSAGCVDQDGDGFGAMPDASCTLATIDCDDRASGAWQPPGPTSQLIFETKTTMSWLAPSYDGGATPLTYDTLASQYDAHDFHICVETGFNGDTTTQDYSDPGPGERFFFLTRARNYCPTGGSLGTTSAGVERVGVTCP